MQQLHNASDTPHSRQPSSGASPPSAATPPPPATPSPLALAKQIMESVPRATFVIRETAYRYRSRSVSFPQLRLLAMVHKCPLGDLSTIARQLSLSLSATSRLVEHLVEKNLLLRQTPPDNRRKIALSLTPSGKKTLEKTTRAVEKTMATHLANLPPADRQCLSHALTLLNILTPP